MKFEGSPPCTNNIVDITKEDLPLCCPQPQNRLWDGHPKVYLPIEETGTQTCPYCGTVYRLSHFSALNQSVATEDKPETHTDRK